MTQTRQRDTAPDVLRGFALLGILIVNIPFMALNSQEGARGDGVQGFANGSAAFIMSAIFLGKFYLLFSFLFGYSSGYIVRGERANRKRWLKRCIVLMILGAIHFTLLWHGDILFMYGLFGLLLLPFFFRADRTLKIWTRAIYGTFSFLLIVFAALVYIGERFFPEESLSPDSLSTLDEVLRDGTFLESIAPRLELWVIGILGSGLVLQGGFAFAAFLVGLRAARANFLSDSIDLGLSSKMIRYGFFIGLPIQVILAWILVRNEQSLNVSEATFIGTTVLAFAAAPLLSMGYVGLILRLIKTKSTLVAWMSPAGRMSLTVYISQSILASFIFGPWGLGLFQKIELWQVLLTAVGIWIFLVYISKLWLGRFSQGPLEWLVGALTRGQ